jgi:hypothetical protein
MVTSYECALQEKPKKLRITRRKEKEMFDNGEDNGRWNSLIKACLKGNDNDGY